MKIGSLALSVLVFAAGFIGCCTPLAAGFDPYMGEIATFAFRFCPRGWEPLNGQLLPISQNQALFSLLGTTYGGDGRTNFALPLAKPVFTLKAGAPMIQCIATQGIYPSQ